MVGRQGQEGAPGVDGVPGKDGVPGILVSSNCNLVAWTANTASELENWKVAQDK